MRYPVDKCPKCGGADFYIKQKISGSCERYGTLDGTQADNSSLHDYLNYRTISKYARCVDCKTKLFEITDEMMI